MLCSTLFLLSSLCSLALAAPHVEDAARAVITPAPAAVQLQIRAAASDSVDPVELAQILLTGVPESLRELAATNVQAASKELWSEFLDGKTPSWFAALPTDIQHYLSDQFAPKTDASTTPSQTASASDSASSGSDSAQSTRSPSVLATSTPTATDDSGSPTNSLSLNVPTSTDSPHHGLSKGAIIGLGVGVGLAVLLIVLALIACCLLFRRRRRRRNGGMRGDSRPPTPAFLSSSFQRTPGGYGGYTGASHHDGSEKYGAIVATQPYGETRHTPIIVNGNGNGRRSGHQSVGSLHAVPEEEPDMDAIGVIPPTRSPRRSRHSLSNPYNETYNPDADPDPFSDRNRIRNSYVPVPSPTAANFNNARNGYDHSPEPDISSHPAYRNRNSFSTPYGPYQAPNSNRRSLNSNVGGYAPVTEKPYMNGDSGGAFQPTTTTTISSPKRKSLSSNPFKKGYWKQPNERPENEPLSVYEGT